MPHTSPFGKLPLKETDVFSFLFNREDKTFDDEQIIFQDGDVEWRNYSYSQIQKLAHDFGRGLKYNHDLKKGSVVAVFSPNDIDYAPVVFGALWAGGCVSPVNPGFTVAELTHQLKDSKAKIVVTPMSHVKTARQAAAAAGIPECDIIIMGARKDISRTYKHWSSYSFLAGKRTINQPTVSAKNDLAFLIYRPNSSGTPRGVRFTHHNLTSNVETVQATEHAHLDCKTDSMLSHLPAHHVFGLTHVIHAPVYHGFKTVVMPTFGIEKWCALAQQHKCTVAYIEPSTAHLLSSHPAVENYDLSSIKMAVSGTAPMNKDLIQAVHTRTGLKIKQAYGLCEASPTAFAQRWDDWNTAIGSSGVLLPNMEAKFCLAPEADGYTEGEFKEVGVGEIGEIFIRGPSVFGGLHKAPVATKGFLDREGWLRTGNIGFINENGHVYVTDKVKHDFLVKRFHVTPKSLITDTELLDGTAILSLAKSELGGDVFRAIANSSGAPAVIRHAWVF